MNRILTVTDEDDTLVLEFLDLDDLRNEGILPGNPVIDHESTALAALGFG